MVHILVNGTTITAWGPEPPEGDGVPFLVDDGGWIEQQEPMAELHWNGSTFWAEQPKSSIEELEAAICELYEMIVGGDE